MEVLMPPPAARASAQIELYLSASHLQRRLPDLQDAVILFVLVLTVHLQIQAAIQAEFLRHGFSFSTLVSLSKRLGFSMYEKVSQKPSRL